MDAGWTHGYTTHLVHTTHIHIHQSWVFPQGRRSWIVAKKEKQKVYTCVTLERASKDRDQLYSSWMSVLSRSALSFTSDAATALVSTEWR